MGLLLKEGKGICYISFCTRALRLSGRRARRLLSWRFLQKGFPVVSIKNIINFWAPPADIMCAVASSYARLPAQNHAYIFRRRLCEWYDILNTHHMCTCWRHSYRRFHARQFSYILRPGSYETHVLLGKQLVCTFTTYCTENNVHNIMRTIFQGATLRVTLIPNRHHMCMCWVFLKKHPCKKFIIHVAGRAYEHIPCSGDNLCARSRHIVIQNSCGQCHAYIFQGFFANDIASEKTPHVHVPKTFV